MAVFRVEKTKDYTVMSNHHLRNPALSLKGKGLISLMLSLPDTWDYSTRGLASICKDGVDSINTTLRELERHGYLTRVRQRGACGRMGDAIYTIYEHPIQPQGKSSRPKPSAPEQARPEQETPKQDFPIQVKPAQLSTKLIKYERINNL